MQDKINSIIKEATGSDCNGKVNKLQSLWSGYGSILRCGVENYKHKSIIIKHISIPEIRTETTGHLRKIKSYRVEAEWYKNYSEQSKLAAAMPSMLCCSNSGNNIFLVLEDLAEIGFTQKKNRVNIGQAKLCIEWLANFHARWMTSAAEKLWEKGTYWHLDTRPDELAQLNDKKLQNAAAYIDRILDKCLFKTILHGDAKLDNFCFSANADKVAAFDFQYTGLGCGMKDLVYLLGCIYDESQCETQNPAAIDYYFSILVPAVKKYCPELNAADIEHEWRKLFEMAWADFHRFYKAWSGGHWDSGCYSEKLSRKVINEINSGKWS
jgi:aminoglycoside phosphotransferase (APT) family kinase protein